MIKLNKQLVVFPQYANGELNLKEDFLASLNIIEGVQEISWSYRSDSDIIKIQFLKMYLEDKGLESTFLINYLPYARMDRTNGKYPFTLKYLTTLINNLNFKEVGIVECHSQVGLDLINNSKQILLNMDLLERVQPLVNFDSTIDHIVYPDKGASDRYPTKENVIVAHKERDFVTNRIKSLEILDDVNKGAKAIIVDDICSYGGTVLLTAKALKEKGISEVYFVVAHTENAVYLGDIFKTDYIDKIFTTDSILTANKEWVNKKFEDRLFTFEI